MLTNDAFMKVIHEWMRVFMHHSMHWFVHYVKERGLSMSQVNTLMHLNRKECSSVTDISDDLGITNAATSQMLERLVQQSLIARTEAVHDRRHKQIELTDAGHQLLHEMFQERERWLEDLAKRMSPSEQEQVAAALRILVEHAKQLGDVSEGPA
jgi:DNA-binding MarR family transcriptional regulator